LSAEKKDKAELYTTYPISSLLIYNGATILHFLLGGIGIMLGYGLSWASYLFGAVYLVFAFGEMYVLMPLKVCPNCVYYKLENSLCISGMNMVSKRLFKPGDPRDFAKRGAGFLCPNNLYIAALFVPIIGIIPALIINFSLLLLAVFLILVGLLLFRFFVIFSKIACLHCRAKYACPQAEPMGVRDL
jgi:hypothetical protein